MRSARMLSWFGARCCTSTKAMPGSVGMLEKNASNAARPPAEAPMPTMGKAASMAFSVGTTGLSAGAKDWGLVFLAPLLAVILAPHHLVVTPDRNVPL